MKTAWQNSSLFSTEQVGRLTSMMTFHQHQPDSLIAFEHEEPNLIYIQAGKAWIHMVTNEGKEMILFAIRPGDLFIAGDYIQYECIRAVGSTVIGHVPLSSVESALAADPGLSIPFIRWQNWMRSFVMMKLRDLTLFGKTGAFASTLIRLANTYGETFAGGIRINLKITTEELARLIGSTRETVSRILRDYKANGILTFDRHHIVIQDPHFLKCEHQCLNCPLDICRT